MLNIGDKVKILNENSEGIVKKIKSAKWVFVEVEGFEYEYPAEHLVKIEEDSIPAINIIIKDIVEQKEKLSQKNQSQKIREIDLHIEVLLENTARLNSTEKLNYQLKHFKNELEKAIADNEKKLIIIHGKGEGILKGEVRKILKSYGFTFYDALLKQYGGGATEVEISQR